MNPDETTVPVIENIDTTHLILEKAEPSANDEVIPIGDTPKAKTTTIPKLFGMLLLAILFAGSAGLTLQYLADVTGPQNSNLAAAATVATNPFAAIDLEAKSAYVLDLQTNHVLYSLNPDAQLPLASLTKIALVLAVSEVLPPDAVITIPRDTSPKGSAERLAAGERWRVQDVMTFTLVASSNTGAEILAEAAHDSILARYPDSPEIGAALWRMNELARELGLSQTYFLNVNGLDLSTSQAGAYGSARDMAALFAYAVSKSPDLFGGTVRDGLLLTSVDGSKTSAFNTDKALGSIHGLIMGKTGITDLAGGNLGIVFDVGPAHPVVAIVLGSTEDGRFEDMKKLVHASEEAIALQ